MDVSCPQCQTLYEFDEAQLRSVGSVNLKCSQCEHLFRLEVPEELRDESQRRWMVRKAASGDVLYFWGFDELHRWIMSGEVEACDAISRTGARWSELGSIGEFAPIFQVVASIAGFSRSERSDGHDDRATQSFEAASSPSSRRRQTTQPNHGAARHAGVQTPVPQRADQPTPAPARVKRSAPTSAEAERPPVATPLAPRLNLDEERFGVPSAPSPRPSPGRAPHLTPVEADDDTWSLGDLSVTQSGSHTIVEPLRPPGRSRGGVAALAVFIVLAAALGGAWHQGLLSPWIGPGQADPGLSSEASARATEAGGESDEGAAALRRATSGVAEARGVARRRALAPLWEAAIASASREIAGASERSERAARRAHEPDIDAVLAAARRALERGDASGARARYHRAIEIDQNSPEAITGLGWALLELGALDSAVAQFRRAIYRDATYGDAYIGLGRAERDRGNLGEALEAYQTYLARLPSGPQASIARFQSEQLRRSSGRD